MPDGSWDELDTLVRRHLAEGLRVAVRLCGQNEAEDVLQEALLKVVRSFRRLDDPRRFRVWFLRIVLNAARDWQRRQRRRREVSHDRFDTQPARVRQSESEARELCDRLQEWIDELPRRQREALILTRFGRLSVREAAEAMETTEQNVRTLVSLARATLRERLRREFAD